ncbi:hypothetical protein CNECB9_4140050 [Cupriavidus necator]|uniref:Uncharacterized protein n=1 Tax=Cupriavidus necator TaxID=106590 RepID=A0A1K0IXK3_CUPNE|nr:hypothetical protein CNECB9_4140050 [Cupriavidus necator]
MGDENGGLSQAGSLEDALKRPGGQVLLRMRDRYQASLLRMFEVVMTAGNAGEHPAILLKNPNQFGRSHRMPCVFIHTGCGLVNPMCIRVCKDASSSHSCEWHVP